MYRQFLALRYLVSRPINLLGMIAVMLGVWALILVVSIFSGFIEEVRRHVRASNSDAVVVRLGLEADYAVLERTLLADANVEACAPRIVWNGLLHPRAGGMPPPPKDRKADVFERNNRFVSLIGIDPEREPRVSGLGGWLRGPGKAGLRVPGGVSSLAASQSWILLSEQRAGSEGLRRGEELTITTARLLGDALDFLEEKFTAVGFYATENSGFDGLNAFVHIDQLRTMLFREQKNHVNEIAIDLKQDDAESLAETLHRLEESLAALPAYRNTRSYPPVVQGWEDRNRGFLEAVEHQRSLMALVLFVIIVVAGFLVYATLSSTVMEKIRDIGILTAMGGTRTGVMQVFLGCGLAITFLGTVLGVVTGCVSAIYLDSFNTWLQASFGINLFPADIYNLHGVPHHLDPLWITVVASVALGLGLVVSGLPALRAARQDPLVALRNE